LFKLERSDGSPHLDQLRRRQRDHVWNGPHERIRDRAMRSINVVESRLNHAPQVNTET
jgi:hypothetical protein